MTIIIIIVKLMMGILILTIYMFTTTTIITTIIRHAFIMILSVMKECSCSGQVLSYRTLNHAHDQSDEHDLFEILDADKVDVNFVRTRGKVSLLLLPHPYSYSKQYVACVSTVGSFQVRIDQY